MELNFKYLFTNVTGFEWFFIIYNENNSSIARLLSDDGRWLESSPSGRPKIRRGQKKRNGSLSIKSASIPSSMGNCWGRFTIYFPNEASYHTPPEDDDIIDVPGGPDGVNIYPVKLGVIDISGEGRQITITNKARFSAVQDKDEFNFIDTGSKNLSNTLFVGEEPARNWASSKPGITPRDIEQHMAQSNIDQYAKSVGTFESTVYSNSIEFYNVFEVDDMPSKRFIQLRDKYNVRECQHDLLLEEFLPEQGAQTDYVENDLDDSK